MPAYVFHSRRSEPRGQCPDWSEHLFRFAAALVLIISALDFVTSLYSFAVMFCDIQWADYLFFGWFFAITALFDILFATLIILLLRRPNYRPACLVSWFALAAGACFAAYILNDSGASTLYNLRTLPSVALMFSVALRPVIVGALTVAWIRDRSES